jgi:hypothetical protein
MSEPNVLPFFLFMVMPYISFYWKHGDALIHTQRNFFKTTKRNQKTTHAVWWCILRYRLRIIRSGEKNNRGELLNRELHLLVRSSHYVALCCDFVILKKSHQKLTQHCDTYIIQSALISTCAFHVCWPFHVIKKWPSDCP